MAETQTSSGRRRFGVRLPRSPKEASYRAAQTLRTAWYAGQLNLLTRRSGSISRPNEPEFQPQSPPGDQADIRKAFISVFEEDRRNVEAGLYPAPENVRPKDLMRTLRSAVLLFRDADQVNKRRLERNGVEARDLADAERYPNYYRQNFHFQSGGWFTDDSARLYDTQVETLFAGSADAMRRSALAEVAREIQSSGRRDLRVIDVACGTGRFLTQLMAAYPRVRASGLDLSPAYVRKAQRDLSAWPRVEILEGDAEAMPVEDDSQDIATCIYLFHELPPRVRPIVAAEIFRVVKPGGLFVFADSIQPGDQPCLDRRLEIFPEGFHEPFYKSYGETDLKGLFEQAGFVVEGEKLAFLTKVICMRKSA